MRRNFLFAKLHQARATHCNLEYEGSFSIDEEIMKASDILENEQIHVYNLENGFRFSTYAIKAPEKSKIFAANGACAHLVDVGDRLIICTYADLEKSEWKSHEPTVLFIDQNNNWTRKAEENQALFVSS